MMIEHSFNWFAFIIAIIVFLIIFIPSYKGVQSEKSEELCHFWEAEEMAVIVISFLVSIGIYFLAQNIQ